MRLSEHSVMPCCTDRFKMLIILHMWDDADAERGVELAMDPPDDTDHLILVTLDDKLSP